MVKLKIIIFILLSCSLAFISSCDQLNKLSNGKSSTQTDIEVHTSSTAKGTVSVGTNYLSEALRALYTRNYGLAVQNAEKATNDDPKNPAAFYVFAQSQAMNNNGAGALKALDEAFKNGFDNPELLMSDFFLESVHNTNAFKDFLKRHRITHNDRALVKKQKKAASDEDVVKAGNVEIRLK